MHNNRKQYFACYPKKEYLGRQKPKEDDNCKYSRGWKSYTPTRIESLGNGNPYGDGYGDIPGIEIGNILVKESHREKRLPGMEEIPWGTKPAGKRISLPLPPKLFQQKCGNYIYVLPKKERAWLANLLIPIKIDRGDDEGLSPPCVSVTANSKPGTILHHQIEYSVFNLALHTFLSPLSSFV